MTFLSEIKQNVSNRIGDVEQMLNDLNTTNFKEDNTKGDKQEIDIKGLDVVDVLKQILD